MDQNESVARDSPYYCCSLSSASFRISTTVVLAAIKLNCENSNWSAIYYISFEIVILHFSRAIWRAVFLFSSSAFTFAPSSIRIRTTPSYPDNKETLQLEIKPLPLIEWFTFKSGEMKWCPLMYVSSINVCAKFNKDSNYILPFWKRNGKPLSEDTSNDSINN